MFIYLSKKIKIAIPNPIPVQALQWNRNYGWIACGGDDGLLKVLRLDSPADAAKAPKGAANLTMNQTLEGHNGAVKVVTWNEHYRKLTTSDEYGLIIVWVLHQGNWYEEMINNRNKSVVCDMKWNHDGQKICIIYEDGAVIVGGVDGNRVWGKELKTPLSRVEWSPNAKTILFGTGSGDVHIYDHDGNFLSRLELLCLEGTKGAAIAGIDWYNGSNGYMEPNCPCLAVVYKNGRAQIMRNELDNQPILLDTMMSVVKIQWNQTGSVLAVAGSQTSESADPVNVVQFYNPFGDHLRTLKIPGRNLKDASWEGGGLRLSLAVDHFIYFANVRPDYRWAYFASTVVYAFSKPNRTENCVVFWDTKNFARYIKYVKNLIGVAAAGNYCVLATKADDKSGQYVLILCNAIGTPVDSRYIDIEPQHLAMTKTHIAAASQECVYTWNYKTSKHVDATSKSKSRRNEKIFHIDDTPTGGKEDVTKFKKAKLETQDNIVCICISNKTLMVGRESGTLNQYALPKVSLQMRHLLNCRPDRIALNCTSTRLAIIDINGLLTFFDPEVKRVNPETGETQYGEHFPSFERKDVWDMKWSEDEPELFAMMERTYMYIFRDLDPEEPINTTGYICQFNDLQIRTVLLDEIMRDPEHPTKENLLDRDIKSLRDSRVLLDRVPMVSIEDAYSFIEQNSHPRLWRLLAESALSKLDFEIAEKAFVRCQDYQGLEFVKKLRKLDDKKKQEAEVCSALTQDFEQAEQIYAEMDRRDLAINLRRKLGDWFRVVQILRTGGGGDDKTLELAYNQIGNYYADRQRYQQAVKFFVMGNNQMRLAECYYRLEDYTGLEEMVQTLPEQHPLLVDIAEMFSTVGLCRQAVAAYSKTGKIKESINVCVSLNQWDLAVHLAKQHNISEIDTLLAKYASHLLSKNKTVEAIELYRKAHHYLDAAKLLFQMARECADSNENPLRAKKLYVLAALQVEAYHDQQRGGSDSARSAIDGLLAEDSQTETQSKMIDTAWHGAEAFHFLLMAQRQLYAGQYRLAIMTAKRLTEYDDIVDPVQAYSILALAALVNKNYAMCSKAFIKLESLGASVDTEPYEKLALEIFTKHPPKDSGDDTVNLEWEAAGGEGGPPKFSVVTGRPMVELEFWLCEVCKHRATEAEINTVNNCPLCHSPL